MFVKKRMGTRSLCRRGRGGLGVGSYSEVQVQSQNSQQAGQITQMT